MNSCLLERGHFANRESIAKVVVEQVVVVKKAMFVKHRFESVWVVWRRVLIEKLCMM